MKRQEMQKPLVQSALVLLAAFILIGFVAGSDAQGILGGIVSIIKGVFFSILFAIALAISLVISVVFLIAIFLGAVALYSPDSAKNYYSNLKVKIAVLFGSAPPPFAEDEENLSQQEQTGEIQGDSTQTTSTEISPAELIFTTRQELSKELTGMRETVTQLNKHNNSIENSLSELKTSMSQLPVEDIAQKTAKLEQHQEELSTKLAECLKKLDKVSADVEKDSKATKHQSNELANTQTKISSISAEINELRQTMENSARNVSSDLNNHRIFNYIDNDEDKRKFSELIEKAIKENMTYAEINVFLSKSLPKNVFSALEEHPALTKQYIRDCKNK